MSDTSTPLSSPPTSLSGDEKELSLSALSLNSKPTAFRFFELPPELRSRILSLLLCQNPHLTIDLHPNNYRASTPRLNYFLVSKRFGCEAYHIFYSTHTFRIFPIHGRFLGKRTSPLLARLPLHYLDVLTSLELRLGIAWTDPPKPWFVSERLGLERCKSVRTLRVFVEVDPSSAVFNGFRIDRCFYTNFCGSLLARVMEHLPVLETVEYDAYPSVDRDGSLMTRLLEETKSGGKKIAWGRERDWGDSLADKLELARVKAQGAKAV
ncbi:MAG: hypothetical protein L6R40_000572 [Gallowayella cf. fulva]|nr:MAG: hypothetical protein L6R40_000572 [Xanthomendoza cf. fulva]